MSINESLKKFIDAIEKSGENSVQIQRWQDRIEELQETLAERIILLCYFSDKIPENALIDYANLLNDTLVDKKLVSRMDISPYLKEKMLRFAEIWGDASLTRTIREAIKINQK